MDKLIAAQISNIDEKKDTKEMLLDILSLLGYSASQAVLDQYLRIKNKELTVVNVHSAVKLSDTQISKIEIEVKKKFAGLELIFVYDVDAKKYQGLKIIVGDNSINF